jgi:uncharacterized membrane protein
LLLTAVAAKDYLDYGVNHQVVNPVWRVYVASPVAGLSWDAAAKPLIHAAAARVATLSAGAEGP